MTRGCLASLALVAGCDEAIVNVDVPDDVPTSAFSVSPGSVDFETLFVGETRVTTVSLTNTGTTPLRLSLAVQGGLSMAYTLDAYTADVPPGAVASHVLTFTPTTWGNHGVSLLVTDLASDAREELPVSAWVFLDDDGDGHGSTQSGGADCDDDDDTVYPGASDPWYDGTDQDCAGNDDYDQDADGVQQQDDCDDTDPARFPGNEEAWYDGIDGDCNGLVDDASVAEVATGVVYGVYAGQHLGDHGYLATGGDLTGDGLADAVLGSPSNGYGYALMLDGATLATATGDVDEYATAVVVGSSAYMPVGYVNGPAGDVDGDGTADLLVGAGYGNGYYGYGRGYMFHGGAGLAGSLPVAHADASFDGDDASDFERMVASLDLDGDGRAEVIVGAALDDGVGDRGGGTDAGSVAIYDARGVDGAMEALGAERVMGDADHDYLGSSLTTGDMDGDGYGDVIAGAPGHDGGASGGGAVYVLAGNAILAWTGGIGDAAALAVQGGAAYLALGDDTLPHPGDVDGDGALDLGLTSEAWGAAWVFLAATGGGGTVDVSSADLTFSGNATDLGSMMVLDSDLDGDGADEIAIGADGDDTVAVAAGLVHVFAGGAWGAHLTGDDASVTIYGRKADHYFGSGGAGGADLDGDGREDLLVGEWAADDTAADGGAVWFIPGW